MIRLIEKFVTSVAVPQADLEEKRKNEKEKKEVRDISVRLMEQVRAKNESP